MRRRTALALIVALALGLVWALSGVARDGDGKATYLASYSWHMDDPHFGGFSGLEVSADGTRFTAISDHGYHTRGRLIRRGDVLTGVEAGPILPLLDPNGLPLTRTRIDAEGLAIQADGREFVSFERFQRVWAYPAPDGPAARLPRHPDFEHLLSNASLEAIAIDDRGWLYTLPERSGAMTRPFPVYRFRGEQWDKTLSIPRSGNFLAVGADFGPDGRLYVLERAYNIFGFRARLRRWVVTETGASDEETLIETATGTHDNLEGVSIWRDADGDLRATLVSDDNFNPLQRSELVEYRLPE